MSITLKGGRSAKDPRLDRVPSPTDQHVRKYPLTANRLAALDKPSSMAWGTSWYRRMFRPVKLSDGRWWIGVDEHGRELSDLGPLDGGHCFAVRGKGIVDLASWQTYYNQLSEGRCVQFGVSRVQSHNNRKRYEVRETAPTGRWLYFEAQRRDYWPGGSYPGASPVYEGTSVDAGCQVAKNLGLVPYGKSEPMPGEGIEAYYWATSYDAAKQAVGYADKPYVPFNNSWGLDFPHTVYIPDGLGERLFNEDGEFAVMTDRVLPA